MTDPVMRILPRADDDRPLLDAHGFLVVVPPGWEVRMRRQGTSQDEEGATAYPVFHAATVALPPDRGDYGSNVVERLGSSDLFVSLVEFGPEAVDTALFPVVDEFPSSLDGASFHPRQLQRVIAGQAGLQKFFTYNGRAFCLYVVVGSYALVNQMMPVATELLASLVIASP